MNLRRATMFGVTGAVLAAMLAGAAIPYRRPAIVAPIAQPAPIDRQGAELAAEIARVRERLRPTAAPQQTRNLFRFSAPAARPAPPPSVAAASDTPAAVAPVAPPMRLIGIAEDVTPEGPVRTAIVTASEQLYLVKEGEAVTLRYRVARISTDTIELVDLSDGTPLRLALR
jgi:hypothetical protein